MEKIILTYIGSDSNDRPVYKTPEGILLVDTDPRTHHAPKLSTKLNNAFDGEPDTPIEYLVRFEDVKFEFTPKRIVWH